MIRTMKEMEGLRLAARFAIQPNMMGLCGEKPDQEILRRCVRGEELNARKVRTTIGGNGFPHLNAFIWSIGQITRKDDFAEEVVQSYWYGNNLTEETFADGRRLLISRYGKLIPVFDSVLKKKLPANLYLTHLTQVALIVAEHYVEPERSYVINQDMVAGGVVIEANITDRTAIVDREEVEKVEAGGHRIIICRRKVKLDPDLTTELNAGDKVAIHLGYVAAKLADDEASNLSIWNRKVAALI